jgi:DNA-directed RNA polymerase specialized sigma24 family protein
MNADEPDELTFADVLNGLTRTRRSQPAAEPAAPSPPRPQAGPVDVPVEENAAIVRAYAWTGGRTRPDVQLAIETLVSTTPRAEAVMAGLRSEHQAVARLCRLSRSVAEIAALLSLPLGVVRVLLADMASLGLVEVHQTINGLDDKPDVELLHRVLRGLTNLRG